MEALSFVESKLFRIYEHYSWTLTFADQRSSKWPLMGSPLPTLAVLGLYFLVVIWGPKLMATRKPFVLRGPMVVFNLGLVALNLFIAVELLYCALKRKYSWSCQLVDTSDNPYELRIASALWWYYFSKVVELLDTVFFVLRKKWSQLTFLHVYHHSTMCALWWIGVKWVPGGSALPGAMANSFVHVVMYLYYGLAALGPKMQKYLFWKKYLTVIQLCQFTIASLMGIKAIITNCLFTRWMQYALVAYSGSFLVLFGKFYANTYSSSKTCSSRPIQNGGKKGFKSKKYS